MSYNATYRWDRGATIDDVEIGNTVANQAAWNFDGRISFENFYNKIGYLKRVNDRFSGNANKNTQQSRNNRRFNRIVPLSADTSTLVTHNLRTSKVRVTATDAVTGRLQRIESRVVDDNTIEILTRSDRNLRITVTEVKQREKLNFWTEASQYATRLLMSPRTASVRYRATRSLSLPLFIPDIGNVFGQSRSYGPMAPGLDFAFGFTGEDYIDRALSRGWLLTDDGQTSPALFSRTSEFSLELNLEPITGLKIQLTANRTDNRTKSVQFMYAEAPTSLSGSFTMTSVAIASALRNSSAANGYESAAFNRFLEAIPVVRERLEQEYAAYKYPTGGFMEGSTLAGTPYNPSAETIPATSSDVLIPAFLAAYTGRDPLKQNLNPFPSIAAMLPNWRVTYDGLVRIPFLARFAKAFTLTHAYQCTYSVGSYSSFLNWVSVNGSEQMGFTLDEQTSQPVPSSAYNISSVAVTERFAPLIGAAVTLQNDMTINAEWRNTRTLTLNTSAGQVVESTTSGITLGVGYKIVGFNTVLKMRGTGQGFSNDLTVNADFSYQLNQALIRRIETAYTQATSGTRTIGLNLAANYALSRRLTVGLFFDHNINTPIVSTAAYPVTDTSFGLNLNLSLSR